MKNKKEETRCTGHCCQDFTLPYSLDELRSRYHAWRRDGQLELRKGEGVRFRDPVPEDIHLIYPMLIYLGHYSSPLREFVNPPQAVELAHHYTCKHYDKKTRNCTIYADRPAMCREYPYSSKCNYSACAWTDQKQEKEFKKKERDGDLIRSNPRASLAVLQEG